MNDSHFDFKKSWILNWGLFTVLCILEILANPNQPLKVLASTFYVALLPYVIFVTASRKNVRDLTKKYHLPMLAALAFAIAIYYYTHVLLAGYKLARHLDFDFGFIWYNRSAFLITLAKIFGLPVLALLVFSLICLSFLFFLQAKRISAKDPIPKIRLPLLGLFCLSLAVNAVTFSSSANSTVNFIKKNFLIKKQISNEYNQLYDNHIQKLAALSSSPERRSANLIEGINVFILQLESLSTFLVSPEITPNLLKAAEKGVYFPRHYSNTIQTTRAMDVILCGTPPSLGNPLIHSYPKETLSQLNCLPKIFSYAGYETLFFQSLALSFDHTGDLAKTLGFQKLFEKEITKPGDPKTIWGYREDIFYRRIFEYLDVSKPKNPFFAYISICSTNHYPFKIKNPGNKITLPYASPKNLRENVANATFLQDLYLGEFLKWFERYRENSILIILGDHAYPIEMHPGNVANEGMAYEENFRTPMVFIPPTSKTSLFISGTEPLMASAHMDILPTLKALLGYTVGDTFLGHPFSRCLLKDAANECLSDEKINLLAQPFSGGFLVLNQYPEKMLLSLADETASKIQLESDPDEKYPQRMDAAVFFSSVKNFFRKAHSDSFLVRRQKN